MFRFSIVVCTAHVIAFSLGLEWGVVGVAAAYAISTTLVEPVQTVLAARALGVSPMVFFRSVGRVFQAALGMCAAVLAVRYALVDGGVEPLARLLICIVTGAVVYGALCLWRVPELAEEARGLLRRRAVAPAPLTAASAAPKRAHGSTKLCSIDTGNPPMLGSKSWPWMVSTRVDPSLSAPVRLPPRREGPKD